jgi:uncharacterized protein YodC (DUF2158 family)
MSESEIKDGSIVQLKSGGPTMTVSFVETEGAFAGTAWCEWFIQDKAPWKSEGKRFPVTSLRLLEP